MGDFFPTFFHFAQPNVLVILQLLYPLIYVLKQSWKQNKWWILDTFDSKKNSGKKEKSRCAIFLMTSSNPPNKKNQCFFIQLLTHPQEKNRKVACFFSNSSCIFLCWYSMANELALEKNKAAKFSGLEWVGLKHHVFFCSTFKKKWTKNTKTPRIPWYQPFPDLLATHAAIEIILYTLGPNTLAVDHEGCKKSHCFKIVVIIFPLHHCYRV